MAPAELALGALGVKYRGGAWNTREYASKRGALEYEWNMEYNSGVCVTENRYGIFPESYLDRRTAAPDGSFLPIKRPFRPHDHRPEEFQPRADYSGQSLQRDPKILLN